jgi:hypothetical protein
MSSRSATFSDLELARSLSRRLSGQPASAPEREPSTSSYVRFAATPAEPAAASRPHEGLTIDLKRFETWEALLDWCLALTHASNTFVMDPEGFAIAHRGALALEEIQGIGSQLMVAMSQADRLEHPGTPALSVCLEYEAFWVTGLRLLAEERGAFTMAFIAAVPVDRDTRDAIRLQGTHNLAHL